MSATHRVSLACAALLAAGASAPGAAFVNESARAVPCVAKADVVIVGGTTGAVAAAVAAAESGAKVFLAAPYPYLGEDMTATLRLWLEPGETPDTPLAARLFSERRLDSPPIDPARAAAFTYTADRASAGVHKDSAEHSLLRDGKYGSAAKESVQYDGGVTLRLQAEKEERVDSVCVLAYHRADYRLGAITVATSLDGEAWSAPVRLAVDAAEQSSTDTPALAFNVKVDARARHVRITVEPAPGATRVLLGEVIVARPETAPAPRLVQPARPLHVKKTLDEALVAAGVDFVFSSYAVDVLRAPNGEPCGIVIANRSGRQAIQAKVIIDATDRAWVARMAGARFRPFPAGTYELARVVIGGKPRAGDGLRVRTVAPPFTENGVSYDVHEYTLSLRLDDGSFASFAAAEQLARDLTYDPGQQFGADAFFQVPPDPVYGRSQADTPPAAVIDAGASDLATRVPLSACQPAGVPRVFVLGPCADVPRPAARKLIRPCASIAFGARVGAAAAAEARALSFDDAAHLTGRSAADAPKGDVREILAGLRPTQRLPRIPQASRALPVLGAYDVVVVGGGTSGAPAGIAAGRQGARTLVLEYLHGLGGVGTQGAISRYYWGNRVGFSAEVAGGAAWEIEQKAEWWRTTLAKAGAKTMFGVMGVGVFADGERVLGAAVATPEGRGVVLCKVLIDATGNADMAAAASAPCETTDAFELAVQGTGLPPRALGASYMNTDFTIVDETDVLDVSHVLVYAKQMAGDAFDMGTLLDTRERRRIVGEITLTILDQMNRRTFPDTVVEAYSDFDTHGYTVDPYFTLEHPPWKEGHRTHIPYRALLAKGLEGLIVTGLGVSAHRDAIPLIRMQPDVQNMGYAAGVAAAMAARGGAGVRAVDVRKLQEHLVAIGNLPRSVLTDKDSYPMSRERVALAVAAAKDGYKDAAVILANRAEAHPLLREAFASAPTPEARLVYAHILAVLGDGAGFETILRAVESFAELDKGWRYTGQGQFGPNLSLLDRLLYALGRLRDRRAVPAILQKLALLTPASEFSHFRAVTLALESIGDPAAAQPLAELLALPGMQGHDVPTLQQAIEAARRNPNLNGTESRNASIRELMLGRTLFRCGDKDDVGKRILERYAKDLRGHLSRHAQAVLQGPER